MVVENKDIDVAKYLTKVASSLASFLEKTLPPLFDDGIAKKTETS